MVQSIDDPNVCPADVRVAGDNDSLLTAGNFAEEKDSAIALDQKLAWCDLFTVHKEVHGFYLHPRPGAEVKRPRVDRLLTPKVALIARGWRFGTLAIEVKASGLKIGPPICQAMDYGRAAFEITGGSLVTPTWTFLWPGVKGGGVFGTLSSILCQNRIGLMSQTTTTPLSFWCGGTSMLRVERDKSFTIRAVTAGNRSGSR